MNHIIVMLLAWIAGVSTLGMVMPSVFINFAPWVWSLTVIFLILSFVEYFQLKFGLRNKAYLKIFRVLALGLSTFYMGQNYAQDALDKRLIHRVNEAKALNTIVYIHRLNESNRFDPTAVTKQRATVLSAGAEPLDLILYIKSEIAQSHPLILGQYYQVSGRVKPAHSYAVQGVFDQEKWLLQQNIMATMQVQSVHPMTETELNTLGFHAFVDQQKHWIPRFKLYVEQKRLAFRMFIQTQPLTEKGLLLALLTGDESLLSESLKEQFKRLGIAHLLAISGPHVLIFAVVFCFIVRFLISKFSPNVYLKFPRPFLMLLPFSVCVLLYTAFVGFEIPAMRTCLTVLIMSFVILLKQKLHALSVLLLSASVLLYIDPFSILSAAFWLSYGACFILIRVYQTVQGQPAVEKEKELLTWSSQTKLFLKILFDSQWKIFVALFPLVAFIFQQVSWISPLVNIIAIPLIGAVIVPLEVIAACLSVVSEPLGLIIFHLADAVLGVLLRCLSGLENLFNPKLSWLALTPMMIVLIALGILILFFPRGVVPKSWALFCTFPVIFGFQKQQEFRLTILDVGQGQAISIQMPEYNMMVDTGGYYDETKFSVGRQIILPYLFGQGISSLDRIYLTHLDQDHAGAFTSIQDEMKIKQVYSNERDQRFDGLNFEYCAAGQKWNVKDVQFEVLSPLKESLGLVQGQQNELSCVLYISIPKAKHFQHFLMMGDAGWETEYRILQQYPNLKVDVLILGHHGSQHSSSFGFLKRLNPKLAIASAGYENRYNHPHPVVIERLKALSIPFESTIEQGSIAFELQENAEMQKTVFRETKQWLQR